MGHSRFGKGRRGRFPAVGALIVGLFVGGVAFAQPPKAEEEEEPLPPPPSIFDLSYEVRNPRELGPKDFQNRWRRIWGALGMRAHYYPSQLSGPENWPPHLYGGGMNYSIWRDTVTGWHQGTPP